MKLTPGQENLLAAMKSGVKVCLVLGRNPHWFRNDTFRNCSATVRALEKRGFIKAAGSDLHRQMVLCGNEAP